MNKFEILLSILANVQADYKGTEIEDMYGYGTCASVSLKMQDGSNVKVEVTVTEPPKEEKSDE